MNESAEGITSHQGRLREVVGVLEFHLGMSAAANAVSMDQEPAFQGNHNHGHLAVGQDYLYIIYKHCSVDAMLFLRLPNAALPIMQI